MKSIAKLFVVMIVILIAVGGAYAQFAKPEDAIEYRKSAMFLIGHHFKSMGAVVQGKAEYDKEKFAADAGVVKMLSTLPWEASMEPGTDKGHTTMSAAVFSKPDEFKKAAEAFESATAALAEAAGNGDMEAIKAQFGNVAGNCKSCHGGFRTK